MKINKEDITDYSNYKWIKVPKYKMDENLSWEERYKQLEAHHIQETEFLIKTVRELSNKLNHNTGDIFCDHEYESDGGRCIHCGKTVAESLYENKK